MHKYETYRFPVESLAKVDAKALLERLVPKDAELGDDEKKDVELIVGALVKLCERHAKEHGEGPAQLTVTTNPKDKRWITVGVEHELASESVAVARPHGAPPSEVAQALALAGVAGERATKPGPLEPWRATKGEGTDDEIPSRLAGSPGKRPKEEVPSRREPTGAGGPMPSGAPEGLPPGRPLPKSVMASKPKPRS